MNNQLLENSGLSEQGLGASSDNSIYTNFIEFVIDEHIKNYNELKKIKIEYDNLKLEHHRTIINNIKQMKKEDEDYDFCIIENS
jgi:hypothetical protein